MAFKVSLQKKSAGRSSAPFKAASASDPVANFLILDNEDSTCTVLGVSKAGNQVDIAGLAALVVESSDPSVITVALDGSMTFKLSATGKLGNSTVKATATWNDGSLGPFSFDLPCEVKSGPVSGVVVVPGTPVPH